MIYSPETLKRDLQVIGASSWDWPGKTPGRIRPELVQKDPKLAWGGDEKAAFLGEVTEYCWRAYDSARQTAGDLAIGRVRDLEGADLYRKVAEIVGDGTLFDDAAAGNLLKMDKWARVVNDSWVIGGVHRTAKFRLVSPRIPTNLWDASKGFLVVTAREILGLLHFGYVLEQVGPWQMLICRDTVRAANADLVQYDEMIKREGSVPQAIDFLRQAEPGVVAPGAAAISKPGVPGVALPGAPSLPTPPAPAS